MPAFLFLESNNILIKFFYLIHIQNIRVKIMLARMIDKIQLGAWKTSKESICVEGYGTILKYACWGLEKTLRLTNALHVVPFSCISYMRSNY